MRVKVKLRLLKINEEKEIELEEGSSVESLLKELICIYGDKISKLIGDSEKGFGVMVMRNGELVGYDKRLGNEDEVSLILPVAGG